jgi:hypothetical protein
MMPSAVLVRPSSVWRLVLTLVQRRRRVWLLSWLQLLCLLRMFLLELLCLLLVSLFHLLFFRFIGLLLCHLLMLLLLLELLQVLLLLRLQLLLILLVFQVLFWVSRTRRSRPVCARQIVPVDHWFGNIVSRTRSRVIRSSSLSSHGPKASRPVIPTIELFMLPIVSASFDGFDLSRCKRVPAGAGTLTFLAHP